MDMFDMKTLAPPEIRGEFQPIATNVAGFQVCEHLPHLAGVMDKLMSLAQGESFGLRVAELQAAQQANYKRARAAIGANRIRALDRLIELDARPTRKPDGNRDAKQGST